MWLRPVGSPRWSVGVAWYGGDVLLWYRGLSLVGAAAASGSAAPSCGWSPAARPGRDDLALPSDVVVLACRTAEGPRELAMDRLDGDRFPVLGGVGPARDAERSVGRLLAARRPLGVRPAVRARLPQDVAAGVRHPRQDEQQVREPVEVAGGLGVGALARRPPAGPTRCARPAGRPPAPGAAAPRPGCRRAG